MHHALEIQEILLSIFEHCRLSSWRNLTPCSDLAALARTCRAFKEPALDLLWQELEDLSPLVRCISGATYQALAFPGNLYSFIRPLTHLEWNILQNYTRRIKTVRDSRGLHQQSLTLLSNPSTTRPLFLNLRDLSCNYKGDAMNLLYFPLPSLISLRLTVNGNPRAFQRSLRSFPELSPNIRNFYLSMDQADVAFEKFVSRCICQWWNLQTVICPQIALDMDAFVHLSRMPALTWLDCKLSVSLSSSNPFLVFSNLHHLTLSSQSLPTMSQFLSQTQLPALTSLFTYIKDSPSRPELSSFLAGVHKSGAGNFMEELWLAQSSVLSSNFLRSGALLLGLEDLQICMEFRNLRHFRFGIWWKVGLTDSDLLTLTSAWPHLEKLFINHNQGWNTRSGITPNGLFQLLKTCRSLHHVALAVDTQNYTELPRSDDLGMASRSLTIHVLDSIIKTESMLALSAFFASLSRFEFIFSAWSGLQMIKPRGWEVYQERWREVFIEANDIISERS